MSFVLSMNFAVAKRGGGFNPEWNVTLVMVRLSNDMIVVFSVRHHYWYDSSEEGMLFFVGVVSFLLGCLVVDWVRELRKVVVVTRGMGKTRL